VISPRLARDLHLVGEPVEPVGVQGGLAAETVVLESLEVAGLTVPNLLAAAIDIFE
jgi:hypothetical protein